TINAGTVKVAADNNLGSSTSALTFAGGTLLPTSAITTSRPLVVNAAGGTIDATTAGTFTLSSSATTTWSGNLNVIGGTVSLTRSGGVVAVTGSPTLSIQSGATAIDGGSIDPLSDGVHAVSVANAGTLQVTGGAKTIGTISGAGNTNITAGATLLTARIQQGSLTLGGN